MTVVEAVVLTTPADAARPVAGVPYLLRTLLCLRRAGMERCRVVGAAEPLADARLRGAVSFAPAAALPDDGVPRLVVGPGAVVDTALVAALRERARAGVLPIDVARGRARVRVAAGADATRFAPIAAPPPAGTLRHVDDPPAQLETALLRTLENPRDGYLDGLVHRHVSRPLTRRLLTTGLAPNAVTALGIALGTAGGLALGLPWPLGAVLAVALLFCSGVLDCCDGELARIRFAESRLGHVLDVTGDTLVHGAVFTGIALTLARTGSLPDRATLLALATGVLGAFAAITWSEVTEARRHRVPCWENRVLDGVLSPLTTRDWYVFPLLFALCGRLDVMVAAAAVGAQAFWPIVVILVARVLRRARVGAAAPA